VEVVASLSQGRTASAQCGLFTDKSVPVIFEPPCITVLLHCCGSRLFSVMNSERFTCPSGEAAAALNLSSSICQLRKYASLEFPRHVRHILSGFYMDAVSLIALYAMSCTHLHRVLV